MEDSATLSSIVQAFVAMQQWDAAIATARSIEDFYLDGRIEAASTRAGALSSIAHALATAGEPIYALTLITEANTAIRSIKNVYTQAKALNSIARALTQADQHGSLVWFVARSWLEALSNDSLLTLADAATGIIVVHPELGVEMAAAFGWVAAALRA